ncbi:MAG: spondin domain-containing protein [Ectothiorhodospiraceae bacterium]|nr:spondin domain-containing protein [Ectothiorhodospiraceae bacterium]
MQLFNRFINPVVSNVLPAKRLPSYLAVALVSASLLTLSGCSNSDNDDDVAAQATYEVTVVNITNGQPLTPLGVVLHQSGYSAWQLGESVSVGLENLAESGSPADFLAEADANSAVAMSAGSTNGPFGPGSMETVTMTVNASSSLQLTVAAMLANTNDAFTGVTNWNIGGLAVGDSATTMTRVFDAGTEANTETADTMPGPAAAAGAQEGFNADRSGDLNRLTIHPGAVTSSDGLTTSALNEGHRWLTYGAKVVVTRTQ